MEPLTPRAVWWDVADRKVPAGGASSPCWKQSLTPTWERWGRGPPTHGNWAGGPRRAEEGVSVSARALAYL